MFTMLEIFEKLPQVDFVLLSAMVKNSHDIADWLKSVTHRECLVFDDKWKPTRQLQGCLVYEQTEIKQLQNKARTYPQHKSKKKLVASMLATPWCLFCLKTVWDSQKVRDSSKVKLLNHQISLGISLTTRKLTPNRNQVACQIASAFVLNGLRVMIFVDTPRSFARSLILYLIYLLPLSFVHISLYHHNISTIILFQYCLKTTFP